MKNPTRYLRQNLVNPLAYMRWRHGKHLHESVCFYTFHKCASSLFSGYVLKNVDGLRHVDYAKKIYRSGAINSLVFDKTGFVYGPLRLSIDPVLPAQKRLLEIITDSDFVRHKIAVFLVRDPRDILVSAYYSFGYTHRLARVNEIRARQEQLRYEIQSKTLDEYVLDSADSILRNFEIADRLRKACTRSVVLKYEDMIEDWDTFVNDFTKYMSVNQMVLTQIYEKTRPREREDISSRRRSGQVAGFRSKLKEDTIASINCTFNDILQRFEYEI